MPSGLRLLLVSALVILVAGCATIGGPREASDPEALKRVAGEIPEQQLLDVWIELFDPGELPEDEDDSSGLTTAIRDAEARFMPVQLRNSMEKTGYWGAVRVVPAGTNGAEVLVRGSILVSDGEVLELEIKAQDATGREWFERTYEYLVVQEAYQGEDPAAPEAFASLYNRIANDLAEYRNELRRRDMLTIRQVAELRFAADLAPTAFNGHLQRQDDDGYSVRRLPARDDPMYQRIKAIRERDFLLVDTLNGHFDNFHREMQQPYAEWRKARVEELTALREIQREANKRKALGVAAIVGAIALEVFGDNNTRASTGTLRNVMVLGGAYAIKTGFDKDSEATIHREAIEELGDSFTSEAEPLVVEVQGETHELSGSAEAQYTKWRGLLRRIYASETGLDGVSD